MNRWRMLLVCTGIAMAGCPGPTRMETTIGSKTPDDNNSKPVSCEVPTVTIEEWQGQPPPPASPTQIFETFWDANGDYVALLVDAGGKIPWGTKVKKPQVGSLLAMLAELGPIDGTRPPPPPPPPIVDYLYFALRGGEALRLDTETKVLRAQCPTAEVKQLDFTHKTPQ